MENAERSGDYRWKMDQQASFYLVAISTESLDDIFRTEQPRVKSEHRDGAMLWPRRVFDRQDGYLWTGKDPGGHSLPRSALKGVQPGYPTLRYQIGVRGGG